MSSVTPADAWARAKLGTAEILDLRTRAERQHSGWPPGARKVSLVAHVIRPRGHGTIYLCQHAKRSRLTLRRGADEVAGGWKRWLDEGLPAERS